MQLVFQWHLSQDTKNPHRPKAFAGFSLVGWIGRLIDAVGLFTWQADLANAGLGNEFQIESIRALLRGSVDQGGDGRDMNASCHVLIEAKAAVKVPKIDPFGQCLIAFALHVLANLVFDGFQNAVAVFAFNVDFECLFHNIL